MKLAMQIKVSLNETCSKVRLIKNLPDVFSIQNDLKQGCALSPFFFNFALEYVIIMLQGNQSMQDEMDGVCSMSGRNEKCIK
jgi:hypothetical protein